MSSACTGHKACSSANVGVGWGVLEQMQLPSVAALSPGCGVSGAHWSTIRTSHAAALMCLQACVHATHSHQSQPTVVVQLVLLCSEYTPRTLTSKEHASTGAAPFRWKCVCCLHGTARLCADGWHAAAGCAKCHTASFGHPIPMLMRQCFVTQHPSAPAPFNRSPMESCMQCTTAGTSSLLLSN